jgi:poly-gamma-glutamate capsule biosynthesis protein CapA/YwtB (metallophosphatase superfamily)
MDKDKNEPVKIGLVGDVMLGELLENYKHGVRNAISKKHVDPFFHVRGTLSEFDLNIANLECPVSDHSCRKGFFREILRAPGDFADILKNAPFHALGFANNHSLDHGREALRSCVSNLEDRGILVFGVEAGKIRQTKPVEVSVKGIEFHLWAFNLSNLDKGDLQRRVDHIRGCLAGIAKEDCKTLLYLHWGEEYTDVPPSEICKMATELSNLGADFVIGHHSHRLQGLARIGGTVFAPSLGNFIFDDRRKDGLLTAILELTVEAGSNNRSRLIPFLINADFQPVPAPDRQADIGALNAKLATQLEAMAADDVRIDDLVAKAVAAGHAKNRVRMRLLMLAGFPRYAGFYSEIARYVLGRDGEGFSVTDEHEWE